MTKISFNVDKIVNVTETANPDDSWDRDNTSTTWYFDGTFNIEKEYGDITTKFDIDPKETYYLLYVIYSTGDSFGHDEGFCVEYVDLYRDENLAHKAAKIITDHNRQQDWRSKTHDFTITLDCGEELKYGFVPWYGFFDKLDYVEVLPVILTKKKKRYK